MRNGKIVLVDDNEAVVKTLKVILAREFRTVLGVSVPTLLPALLREDDVDIVLLDMNFGTGKQDGGEGLFWLDRIRERANPPAVILITAFGDVELAVSSLKKGATDFVVKPWDNDKLIATVTTAYDHRTEGYLESRTVIQFLIGSLLKKFAVSYGKPLPSITPAAFQKLSALVQGGDLTVLHQTIERAVLLANTSMLHAQDFYVAETASPVRPLTLDEMEKQFIREVLAEKKGNLTLSAQQLDISRQTLYNKMRKYDL